MGHTTPQVRSLHAPERRIEQAPVESRNLLVLPWPLQSSGNPAVTGVYASVIHRRSGAMRITGKRESRKMPASAGEVALVPVFPLFSSGKTVKA